MYAVVAVNVLLWAIIAFETFSLCDERRYGLAPRHGNRNPGKSLEHSAPPKGDARFEAWWFEAHG